MDAVTHAVQACSPASEPIGLIPHGQVLYHLFEGGLHLSCLFKSAPQILIWLRTDDFAKARL